MSRRRLTPVLRTKKSPPFTPGGAGGMTVPEILEALDRHFIYLERSGDKLQVHVCFPDRYPLPPALKAELKTHKPELLKSLRFEDEADRLLLKSTHRLAAAILARLLHH